MVKELKRILCIMLAVLMALSNMTFFSFAEEAENVAEEPTESVLEEPEEVEVPEAPVYEENTAETVEETTESPVISDDSGTEAIEAAVKNYQAKKNKETDMITVSEKATAKIKELLAENKSIGITISVISGGCSGIDYTLAYEAEEDANKSKVVVNDVNFYYDPALELLIKGTTIDIVENSFGHGFVVTNKNHVGCCHCNGSCGR